MSKITQTNEDFDLDMDILRQVSALVAEANYSLPRSRAADDEVSQVLKPYTKLHRAILDAWRVTDELMGKETDQESQSTTDNQG